MATCPPSGLGPLQNFDLASFISAPWYAQAMVRTSISPAVRVHLHCLQERDPRSHLQQACRLAKARNPMSMQCTYAELTNPVLCSNQHTTSPRPPCSAFGPCTTPLTAETYW